MASPTTITYAVKEPDTSPYASAPVIARLIGAGDRSDTPGVIAGVIQTRTADDGSFSLSLLPNSAFQDIDTHYMIRIAGILVYTVVVPVSATPVDLWDIRVDPRTLDLSPAPTPPIYLARAERGAVDGVASLGADGKVPAAQLPVGGGSVPTSRVIATSNGLQGGGELDEDLDLQPTYGTDAGTVCQGNDSRLSDARAPTAHTHPQSQVTGLVDALAATAPLESPAFTGTPTGITKTHVGLGNVDNTSDANKPVSTATQTALDGKATKPRFARQVTTSGNIQLNVGTNTWGVLTGAPTLAIAAAAGDLIELNAQAIRQANANIFLDFCVIVAAAPARYMATLTGTPAGEGNPALYHTNLPAAGGVWKWLAEAGDISGGDITIGIAIRNTSGASSLLLADTNLPLQLALENRGAPS